MSERKLATIEKISEIHPIEGADAIERAVIRGWNVVIKKGEFKEGDLCVYCEIDSLMPKRPEFEFLKPRGYRIKTIKLKGQISQGIAFPLEILKDKMIEPIGSNFDKIIGDHFIGLDVSKPLGITKYEAPIPACLDGIAKGKFPSHSPKTDEERIQNLKFNFEKYKKEKWIVTEKLDGSSATLYIWNNEFGIASRNLDLKENEKNSFWKVARERKIEKRMREYMDKHNLKALTLQGELIGEGIQGNKYKIKGQTIRFFRVFDPIKYHFLPYKKTLDIINNELGLETVPIIDYNFSLPSSYDELIKYADGISMIVNKAREGVVLVAKNNHSNNGRLSFKIISNKFILKYSE